MRKKISARTVMWLVAISIAIVASLVSLANMFQALRELKFEASIHQSEMLASAARASLQTDLLNSNLFLASERLKAMLDPHQWNAYCVIVFAADDETKPVLKFGEQIVCDNRDLREFKKDIYFDADQKVLAYRISVRSDPNRLPYSASSKFMTVLAISIGVTLAALCLVIIVSNSVLNTVFRALQNQKVGQGSKTLSMLTEVEAIYQLIDERDHEATRAHKAIALAEVSNAVNQIAAQVSHDIRSPLSALNMVVATLKELPEEKRLIIRNAAQRINDIANGLLQQSKSRTNAEDKSVAIAKVSPEVTPEPVMLVALLDAIVSEKRVQCRERMDIEIQGDLNQGYGLFARVNPVEFARVISNLVNNSVEAMTDGGRVTIGISGDQDHLAVIVRDNGKGIPPEILVRLGEHGVTHGKRGTQSGSGLGIYHARQTIEKDGGTFAIQSQPGFGTRITLTLPRVETPAWFVEKIVLPSNKMVVSVDDDQTIHQIWSGRLSSAGAAKANIQRISFSSMDQFESWTKDHQSSVSLFLIDFEFLGQQGNGLELIERTGIANTAILVTSRYEEPQVRAKASSLGVKILPKALAPFVPIVIEKLRIKYDAVLIDDDPLVHMTWQTAAKEKEAHILCFSSPEEYWSQEPEIDFASPIFIDVSLARGVRGEDVAREVLARGFMDVSLATGYAPESITLPQGVRRVVGKDPLF